MQKTLREISHVEFGRGLGEDEIRELFVYLSRGLSSQIQYSIKRNESVGFNFRDIAHNYPRLTSIEINGAIYTGGKYREHGCGMAPFNCFSDFANIERNKVKGIDFFVAPGYEIGDVSKGEVELFEDTQKLTDEFSELLAERED
ncbi:MAG: hypothetical protein AABX83_02045 [Nanoarchaeota archaeon]